MLAVVTGSVATAGVVNDSVSLGVVVVVVGVTTVRDTFAFAESALIASSGSFVGKTSPVAVTFLSWSFAVLSVSTVYMLASSITSSCSRRAGTDSWSSLYDVFLVSFNVVRSNATNPVDRFVLVIRLAPFARSVSSGVFSFYFTSVLLSGVAV